MPNNTNRHENEGEKTERILFIAHAGTLYFLAPHRIILMYALTYVWLFQLYSYNTRALSSNVKEGLKPYRLKSLLRFSRLIIRLAVYQNVFGYYCHILISY